MQDIEGFREWIYTTKDFKKETKSNIVSRLKRANNILPIENETVYLFNLCQTQDFLVLSVSVKSQIRRAVKLYFEYLQSEGV